MALKLFKESQVNYYKKFGYVIIHRIDAFHKPNNQYKLKVMTVLDNLGKSLGNCRVHFLHYGVSINEGFDSQLEKYLFETGFNTISDWKNDIEKHKSYYSNAEYGAFYKIEKYRGG